MADHYVNNREFTTAVSVWRRELWYPWKQRKDAAEDEGIEFHEHAPPIPDFVGDCFYKIASRYALKPKWSRWSSHIKDMVSEAVLSCLKYAHNFNPDKSQNAFAYFTQCCHHSFLQYINKETKVAKFKFEMVKEANPDIAKMDYNNIMLFDEDNADFQANEQSSAERAIARENAAIHEAHEAENAPRETFIKPGKPGRPFGKKSAKKK